jgi:glycosyltransferase involved in cell wall biosynthesis
MKIVLAASIFPPEIGGPATYAKGLADALVRAGHAVVPVIFSSYLRYPSGIRHLCYASVLFRASRDADLVIAFDVLTTGLPAAIAHRATRVPTVARIGGDFIWERYVEETGDRRPLPLFYEQPRKWRLKDRVLKQLIEFVIGSIGIVFSSVWQRDLWSRYYRLDRARTHVIENEFPISERGIPALQKNFLHYGRQLALKNTPALREAFQRVQARHPEITLEEGSLSRSELLERIRGGYAVVLPSISDVTPNYILDALRFGKPFLLTTYSGYAEKFKECGALVDPLSVESIAAGLEQLLNVEEYARMESAIAALHEVHTYDDIAREFLALR